MADKKVAWAITGAGHELEPCVDLILEHEKIDLYLSRAAEEVLRIYKLYERLRSREGPIYPEVHASSPLVGRLFGGTYSVLVIAPTSSNSVAKFVCGISDTLVTNLFAQAGKAGVPAIVYPTDIVAEMDSVGPHGERIKVYPRDIDLENTEKLRAFSGVRVVSNREELEQCLDAYL